MNAELPRNAELPMNAELPRNAELPANCAAIAFSVLAASSWSYDCEMSENRNMS